MLQFQVLRFGNFGLLPGSADENKVKNIQILKQEIQIQEKS